MKNNLKQIEPIDISNLPYSRPSSEGWKAWNIDRHLRNIYEMQNQLISNQNEIIKWIKQANVVPQDITSNAGDIPFPIIDTENDKH